MIDPDAISTMPGRTVVDSDGKTVGTLVTAYADHRTGEPLWATVRRAETRTPDLIVPLHGAAVSVTESGKIQLAVASPVLDGSPFIDPNEQFTSEHAAQLTDYYDSVRRIDAPSPTRAENVGSRPGIEPQPDREVIRSEERLRVGVRAVPVERVRLRKVIVEEQQTITVTVRREELRVTQMPITADETTLPGAGRLENGIIDMTLHEERVIVTRTVVPVERVRARVIRLTDEVDVTDSVRSERVEVTSPRSRGEG